MDAVDKCIFWCFGSYSQYTKNMKGFVDRIVYSEIFMDSCIATVKVLNSYKAGNY